MIRALVLWAAGTSLAWGQLALFTADPERAVGNQLQIGSVPAGDSLTVRLRLRNTGSSPAKVTLLSVAGAGFVLDNAPALPQTLNPAAALEFGVRFEPPAAGSYSASLRADNVSAILIGSAAPAPAVAVEENGGWRPLASGMVVDFGAVERGVPGRRRFLVSNEAGQVLPPLGLATAGDGFWLAGNLPGNLTLAAGESVSFEVICAPAVAGPLEGALQVGPRHFLLRASGVEPTLPRPEIVLELAEARSASQGKLSVRLDGPSRTRATGEVRLEFQPAAAGAAGDPAVVFSSGGRTAQFSVEEGDSAARFGAQASIDFQTGTTAGTLVFTLDVAGIAESRTVTVVPAPVAVVSTRAVRTQGSVEVTVTGFDNTRAISQLTFTFYDRSGTPVAPGAIRVDPAAAFRQYFDGSGLGGAFLLRAVFPVTGDGGQIETVEAEFTNPAGAGRTARVPFG